MTTMTTFTSYDELRAVLGVSDEEIDDLTLGLPLYHDQLIQQCADISENLVAKFEEVLAVTVKSPAQVKFLAVFKLYAAYQVGANLLVSLPMFSAKRVTDGKAEFERVDAYADLKAGILSMLGILARRLKDAFAAIDITYAAPAAVPRIFILGTGLASDPVTAT